MEMWGKEALQHTHIGDSIVPLHTHICTPTGYIQKLIRKITGIFPVLDIK